MLTKVPQTVPLTVPQTELQTVPQTEQQNATNSNLNLGSPKTPVSQQGISKPDEKVNRPTSNDGSTLRAQLTAAFKKENFGRVNIEDFGEKIQTNPDLRQVELVDGKSHQPSTAKIESTKIQKKVTFWDGKDGKESIAIPNSPPPPSSVQGALPKNEQLQQDIVQRFPDMASHFKRPANPVLGPRPNPFDLPLIQNPSSQPPPLPPRRPETPEVKLKKLQEQLKDLQVARDNNGNSFSGKGPDSIDKEIKGLKKQIKAVEKDQFEKGRPLSGGREFKNFALQSNRLKGFDAIRHAMKFGKNEETMRPDKRYADAIQEAGRQFDKKFNPLKTEVSQRLQKAGEQIQNLRDKFKARPIYDKPLPPLPQLTAAEQEIKNANVSKEIDNWSSDLLAKLDEILPGRKNELERNEKSKNMDQNTFVEDAAIAEMYLRGDDPKKE